VPSSWLELSLRTDPSSLDAVSNFLIERGSPGVVIKKNEVRAYFSHPKDSAAVRKDVQRFLSGIRRVGAEVAKEHLKWRILKDRNWNSAWQKFFHPQRVGQQFLINPPWIKPPGLGRRHLITIEPGLAFGTGTHATTRGCIEYIEQAVASFHGAEFVALDVGTGSGILSIALAKLGAKRVWALDNDPVALKVARANLHCNDVQTRVRVSATNLSHVRKSFPLVVANLTAETILDLASALEKRVAPKGFLILSGILKSKLNGIVRHFAANGFSVVRRRTEKEWATLLFRRK